MMTRYLFMSILLCLAGCSRAYRPKLQAELLRLADPVVKKWHADGFTIEHAFSEKYHAEAGRYAMPHLQPMRDLLSRQLNRPEECLAEIDCIRSHYAGTKYEEQALALCNLLDPKPHIGPVTEPTNGWTLSSEGAPSDKKSP
jgi:hypothetical protein